MIYRLRKKFIVITATTVSVVFALIFSAVCFASAAQLNRTMDMLTDAISTNDGIFPEYDEADGAQDSHWYPEAGVITPETRFSTRFFTVIADENGEFYSINTEQISSVTYDEAMEYARNALENDAERGWLGDYRYKICATDYGWLLVFVNGEMNKGMAVRMMLTVLLVMTASVAVILLLIVLISKKAVKPVAESYEKQRQFVTDANHELKTPLTLILSNVDIVESEIGQNEWLDDIRSEGERMASLINQLVTLSRMDENSETFIASEFDFSVMTADAVSEFEGLAAERCKSITADIEAGIHISGDEGQLLRLVYILLDNAVKYCDAGGDIAVVLRKKGRNTVVTVENTYCGVNDLELDRLFDRFYRADRARTFTGSFGVGLSVASGIVKNHRGSIYAYKKDERHIGFRVTLK